MPPPPSPSRSSPWPRDSATESSSSSTLSPGSSSELAPPQAPHQARALNALQRWREQEAQVFEERMAAQRETLRSAEATIELLYEQIRSMQSQRSSAVARLSDEISSSRAASTSQRPSAAAAGEDDAEGKDEEETLSPSAVIRSRIDELRRRLASVDEVSGLAPDRLLHSGRAMRARRRSEWLHEPSHGRSASPPGHTLPPCPISRVKVTWGGCTSTQVSGAPGEVAFYDCDEDDLSLLNGKCDANGDSLKLGMSFLRLDTPPLETQQAGR